MERDAPHHVPVGRSLGGRSRNRQHRHAVAVDPAGTSGIDERHTRRVALVTDTNTHLGPDLARELARRGHDLVVVESAEGLVGELERLGSTVEAIAGVAGLRDPRSLTKLVGASLQRFGRIDATCVRTGRIVTGSVFASVDTLRDQVGENLESILHIIQAVLPPMIRAGRGQVVIVTSGAGGKPVLQAPIYSATRAAATCW